MTGGGGVWPSARQIGRVAILGTIATILLAGCADQPAPVQSLPTAPPEATTILLAADVTAVSASGSDGAYQFSVTVASPDTGCEQYADWWEVLSEDGRLLYRRVLLHSHVDEQPFTRSGGPVPVTADTVVVVRAHMSNGGYGGAAFTGSVDRGFEAVEPGAGFAPDVEALPPQPEGCAF